MGAAEVGIVADVDVARLQIAGALDEGPGRVLHGADENRQAKLALGDQRPVIAMVDAVGPVHRLGDHRAEGRALEGQVHFVADLVQTVLHHGQGDMVQCLRHGSLPLVRFRRRGTPAAR